MGRYFWQPILGWFAGLAIAGIITSVIFKIGWKNPLEILIWGYAMIGSASVFAWQIFRVQRREDKEDLEKKLKLKVDAKDIDALHDTLGLIQKSQEEVHATVDHIWCKISNIN